MDTMIPGGVGLLGIGGSGGGAGGNINNSSNDRGPGFVFWWLRQWLRWQWQQHQQQQRAVFFCFPVAHGSRGVGFHRFWVDLHRCRVALHRFCVGLHRFCVGLLPVRGRIQAHIGLISRPFNELEIPRQT